MQKDYAKSSSNQNRQIVEQGWRGRLLLVAVIVLVICLVWYAYDEYEEHGDKWNFATVKSWFLDKTKDPSNPVKPVKVEKPTQAQQHDNEIQFNFYTDLPNDKITIVAGGDQKENPSQPDKTTSDNAAPQNASQALINPASSNPLISKNNEMAAAKSAVADKSSKTDQAKYSSPHYIVQIAAFRNASAAGDMRISLLLSGFEVNLVKSLDNEHKQLYLLQQGPFSSLFEAKAMQQKLKQRGIDSVVKKV